jgi:DNA-binding response OmpR family regulator
MSPPEIASPRAVILAVGLDSSLLRTRALVLQSAGYVVQSASSVKDAVRSFLAGDFDLVLLCHSVPSLERDRLTCLIRASGSHTPVASVSGNSCPNDAFVTATLEDGPDKLLRGIRDVLHKAAKAWPPDSNRKSGQSAGDDAARGQALDVSR